MLTFLSLKTKHVYLSILKSLEYRYSEITLRIPKTQLIRATNGLTQCEWSLSAWVLGSLSALSLYLWSDLQLGAI